MIRKEIKQRKDQPTFLSSNAWSLIFSFSVNCSAFSICFADRFFCLDDAFALTVPFPPAVFGDWVFFNRASSAGETECFPLFTGGGGIWGLDEVDGKWATDRWASSWRVPSTLCFGVGTGGWRAGERYIERESVCVCMHVRTRRWSEYVSHYDRTHTYIRQRET